MNEERQEIEYWCPYCGTKNITSVPFGFSNNKEFSGFCCECDGGFSCDFQSLLIHTLLAKDKRGEKISEKYLTETVTPYRTKKERKIHAGKRSKRIDRS